MLSVLLERKDIFDLVDVDEPVGRDLFRLDDHFIRIIDLGCPNANDLLLPGSRVGIGGLEKGGERVE